MRLSNDELKEKYCTFWNDEKHDIGDEIKNIGLILPLKVGSRIERKQQVFAKE